MQNLTTTLHTDIVNGCIQLPSAKAKFNWIDVENIGEVAAILLLRFAEFRNTALELTGLENTDFQSVAELLSEELGRTIKFEHVSAFQFWRIRRRQGMAFGMIVVMFILHYLPRFQSQPNISKLYETLTNKQPTNLRSFIKRDMVKM